MKKIVDVKVLDDRIGTLFPFLRMPPKALLVLICGPVWMSR